MNPMTSIGDLHERWQARPHQVTPRQQQGYFDIKPAARPGQGIGAYTRIAPLATYISISDMAADTSPTAAAMPAMASAMRHVTRTLKGVGSRPLALIPAFAPRIYKIDQGRVIDWHTRTIQRAKTMGIPIIASAGLAALIIARLQIPVPTANSSTTVRERPVNTVTNTSQPVQNSTTATSSGANWSAVVVAPLTSGNPSSAGDTLAPSVPAGGSGGGSDDTETTPGTITTPPISIDTPVTDPTTVDPVVIDIPPVTEPSDESSGEPLVNVNIDANLDGIL